MRSAAVTRRRFLCATLGTVAGGFGLVTAAAGGVKTGDRPKRVTLTDLSGLPVTLPDAFAGKVLVIHFWASWCPSCLPEIDALASLFGQYGERGLLPVSVNIRETQATVAEALRARKLPYPILLDLDSGAARLYGVTGIPTTFILNRAGAIEFKVLGEIHREGLRRLLSGLL